MFCNIQNKNELSGEKRRECNGNVHSRCETAANVSFLADIIYCSLFFRVTVFLLLISLSLSLMISFPFFHKWYMDLKNWSESSCCFRFGIYESRWRDKYSNHGVGNEKEEKVDLRRVELKKEDRKRMRRKRKDGKKMRKRNDSARYQLPSSVLNLLVPSPRQGSRIEDHDEEVTLDFLFPLQISFPPWFGFYPFSCMRMILPVISGNKILLSISFSLQFTQWLSFYFANPIFVTLLFPFSLCFSFRSIEQFHSLGILVFFSSLLSSSVPSLWKEYFTLSFTSWANRHHHNENSREWMDGWRGGDVFYLNKGRFCRMI